MQQTPIHVRMENLTTLTLSNCVEMTELVMQRHDFFHVINVFFCLFSFSFLFPSLSHFVSLDFLSLILDLDYGGKTLQKTVKQQRKANTNLFYFMQIQDKEKSCWKCGRANLKEKNENTKKKKKEKRLRWNDIVDNIMRDANCVMGIHYI